MWMFKSALRIQLRVKAEANVIAGEYSATSIQESDHYLARNCDVLLRIKSKEDWKEMRSKQSRQ
jgi:hypothetical protein